MFETQHKAELYRIRKAIENPTIQNIDLYFNSIESDIEKTKYIYMMLIFIVLASSTPSTGLMVFTEKPWIRDIRNSNENEKNQK